LKQGKQTLLLLMIVSAYCANAQQQGVSGNSSDRANSVKTTSAIKADTVNPVIGETEKNNLYNLVSINKKTLEEIKATAAFGKDLGINTYKKNVTPLFTPKNNFISQQLHTFENMGRSVMGDIKQRIDNPWRITRFAFNIEGSVNNFENDSFRINNYNLVGISAGANMLGVPFGINYTYNYYPFYNQQSLSRFSYQFQREDYLASLQKQLEGKFNPHDFLKQGTGELQAMKNNAINGLQNELHAIGSEYKGLLDNKIRQLGGLGDVMNLQPNTLKQLLLNSEWLQELQTKTAALQQVQERINNGEAVNMEDFNGLKNSLKEYEGVQAVIAKIEEHQRKWEQNGLLKLVRENGLLGKQQLAAVIKDPSVITTMAKEKLNLSGFQRLFLKISGLNIGQDAVNMNPLTGGAFLMNGLNGNLFNNNKHLGFLGGAQRSFNSLNDLPFANSLFNTDNRVMGLNFGNGSSENSHNRISFMQLRSLQNNGNPFSMVNIVPRTGLVATINKRIEFDKMNSVDVELSKTSSQYQNQVNADSAQVNKLLNNLWGGGNFLDNAAIAVNYHGYYKGIQLQQDINVRVSGNNYYNPAGGFMPAGTKEAGANLKKYFLKNKLQVSLRGQLRQYDFNSAAGNKWRNASYMTDVKWKMKKGQYVSLRWQPVQSVKTGGNGKLLMARTNRVAGNASLVKRIRGVHYRNTITLAYQDNKLNTGASSYAVNQSLQFSSLQSFTVGKQLVYANFTYNHVNNPSQFIFYNTSLNADAGLSYRLGNNLTASSALSYQSVKTWYQQVSLKQTLTGQIGKNINLNFYLDAGKTLKQYQPLPVGLVRGEWSIQYLFNQ
jgi:hypothetical protein